MITSPQKSALSAYAKKIVALDVNSHESFLIEDDEELSYSESKSMLKDVEKNRERLEGALEKYFKTRMLDVLNFTSEEYEYLEGKLSDLIHATNEATHESIFYCVGDEDVDKNLFMEKGIWFKY